MRKISALLALVAGLFVVPAHADFTGKDAAAATITFKNPGTCTSVVCVPIFSLFDPTGTNGAAVNTAGANGASNTANGLLTYSRNIIWNGTTWDSWTGDLTSGAWVNVKASALPTGAATAAGISTVNTTLGTPMQNSGGSVTANIGSAGTLSLAANQTTINTSIGTTNTNLGAPGATVCATDTGSCSVNALFQRALQTLTLINTGVGSSVPAGTNLIGKVGIDQTTPGTTNLVALAANQSVNTAQVNGVTTLTGTGATGTGAQRVTVAVDSATVAGSATLPAGTNLIGKTGIDQTTPGTTNAVSVQYGSTASVADPCQTAAKVYTSINVVTATNTIITGVAAKKKYICGIFLYPAGTDNIAIFQATTATSCATALVGVIGGTTTATGIIATAQAGFVLGNGAAAVAATTVNQTDLCIVTSAAVQLSGVVVTVDQ